METVEQLNKLAELKAQEDLLRMKKQEIIDSILTPEIKAELQAIEEETAPEFEAIAEKTKELESEIKAGVLAGGETVKGNFYQGVWSKPRAKINEKAFLQYMKTHPEVSYMLSYGDPSVSIRKVK